MHSLSSAMAILCHKMMKWFICSNSYMIHAKTSNSRRQVTHKTIKPTFLYDTFVWFLITAFQTTKLFSLDAFISNSMRFIFKCSHNFSYYIWFACVLISSWFVKLIKTIQIKRLHRDIRWNCMKNWFELPLKFNKIKSRKCCEFVKFAVEFFLFALPLEHDDVTTI